MLVSQSAVAIEMLWSGISAGLPGAAPAGERVEMKTASSWDFGATGSPCMSNT
jgi:hypothetical protein